MIPSNPLKENLTKAEQFLLEKHPNDQELYDTIHNVFKELTEDSFNQLYPGEKEFLLTLSRGLPAYLYPDCLKVSSVFQSVTSSSSAVTSDLELFPWEEGTADEKEAIRRLEEGIQNNTTPDLSDLNLTRLAECMFTDERCATIPFDKSKIEHVPYLDMGKVLYNQDTYARVVSAENPSSLPPDSYEVLTSEEISLPLKGADKFGTNLFSNERTAHPSFPLANKTSLGEIIQACELNPYLPIALPILKEIIACIKEDREPNFDLKEITQEEIDILFYLMSYLMLDEFQLKYFEPFNEKFPSIPPEKAPRTLLSLNLAEFNIDNEDLSRFTHLRYLNLSKTMNFSGSLNSLSEEAKLSIQKLDLGFSDLTNVSLSGFPDLGKINLHGAHNLNDPLNSLTPEEKSRVKVLDLEFCDLSGVDLSGFSNLEEIKLSYTSNPSSTLSTLHPEAKARIEELDFRACDYQSIDLSLLSGFSGLKKLVLYPTNTFPMDILNDLPPEIKGNLETLSIAHGDFEGVDLSGFERLENLHLFFPENFSTSLSTLPPETKARIQNLTLNRCTLSGVNLSQFSGLRELELYDAKDCLDSLNSLPPDVKAEVQIKSLSRLHARENQLEGFPNPRQWRYLQEEDDYFEW